MTTATRKPISTKTRFDVFKRDGFSCQYCGRHPPDVVLEVDHVVPVAEGGQNDADNLVAACWDCNRGKGARPLSDIPVSLRDKAVEIAEREAQLRGYQDILEAKRSRLDDEVWRVAEAFMDRWRQESIRRDYLQSIKMFIERLGVHPVLDAMEIAAASRAGNYSQNKMFRYFCGVCWNRIKETNA